MLMQNIAIFHGYENGNKPIKKYGIFLIFAQNIDRGYTLGFNDYPRSMFKSKIRT